MPIKDPPADPGAPPAAFDPAAFLKEFLGELDKRVNAIDKKVTALGKTAKPPEGEPPAGGEPPAEPKPAPAIVDPAALAEVLDLRKKVTGLTKRLEESEGKTSKAEAAQAELKRQTAIRTALQEVPFRTNERGESLLEPAYKIVAGDVKAAEDGSYVVDTANGPLLLKDYVKSTFLEGDYAFMTQPKGSGGAGARPGQAPGGGGRRWTKADLEPAKLAALKPDELASISQAALSGEIPMS